LGSNASLEIAHVRCVKEHRSISGQKIMPFKTVFPEGFDINRPDDISRLKSILLEFPDLLPRVIQKPFGE